ncbi:MAG: LacI family transcriptional regulator [Spirochaetaceae bacterium]|nr:MAG: LacI family transcriptional regulator [Spirochaetaceae bacterium]
MAVTIKDVAKLADVSTATVSRVINSDPRISAATRDRVLGVIEKLNYKVNSIARSLKSNRTCTVGFLTPEIANEFFMTVAQGVENSLRERGYNLIICNSNESPDEEVERLELLIEKCVDGVIIAPSTGSGEHLRFLEQVGLPTVLVDRLADGFTSDAVLVDNATGTYKAIHHLLKRGHTNFGFIGGDVSLTPFRERYEGFLRALSEFGIHPDEAHVKFGNYHVDSGYAMMKELAELTPPPASVFISNYFMHIGATQYLVENRARLPRTIFVASFDDMALSAVAGVPSLTIAQPVLQIGRRAAEMLLERIDSRASGTAPPPRIERLPTRLVFHDRNSKAQP